MIHDFINAFLTRYIFLADKVEIQDITKQTSLLVLVGPKSNQVKEHYAVLMYKQICFYFLFLVFMTNCCNPQIMEALNLGSIAGEPYGTHQHFSVSFCYLLEFSGITCPL